MNFSFARVLIFALISLPLGFILTALGFAVMQFPIEAPAIFPWALAIAIVVGCAGGFGRSLATPSEKNDDAQRNLE